MAEQITARQAIENFDRIVEEWVDKDLEKGIPVPFRFWRGGRYKERITFWFWRSLVLPMILLLAVVTCAIESGVKLFLIALACYILYIVIGVWLCKREKGNFILKKDGLTIATQREKLYFPWEAVKNVCSDHKEGSLAYKLTIHLEHKSYVFYELYSKIPVSDSEGQVCKVMMPLHVAYALMNTVRCGVLND